MKGKRFLAWLVSFVLLAGLPTTARAQECAHEALQYIAPAAPTCTQQGTREYWYCADCKHYFENQDFQNPLMPGQEELQVSAGSFTIPALGHAFGETGLCDHCGMARPVYSQVSTLENFDALSADTSYILVVKDGERTYAAHLPIFINPCDMDSDGDGTVDVLQMDANGNTVPDCVEILFADWYNEDMDGDGDIDVEDYHLFVMDFTGVDKVDGEAYKLFLEENYWDITLIYRQRAMGVANFVEVTMAQDGTITLSDEGALEFMLMPAGIWGGEPRNEADFAENNIQNNERVLAAWIPNYWVGGDGMLGYEGPGHLLSQQRVYGDGEKAGVTGHKNWKLSFREDGSLVLVAAWKEYDDTAALQFVKYTDENGQAQMTLVGLSQELWEDAEIMQNRTETLSVYLYAAQPVQAHSHVWDEGREVQAPTCDNAGQRLYTCAGCGETKTEEIAALGHAYTTVTTEPTCTQGGCTTHICTRCGDAYTDEPTEALGHDYVDGVCSRCGAREHLAGDINGDGRVNARDARALLRFIAGLAEEGEVNEEAADVNGDGRVNARDARTLLRQIAGLE